ncbi:hypothetical protein B0X71_03885 [Planococcus lenghuensis]|uniref:Uncharacterized protein n=1 Tax=Planococcus lenghuensis TaxID=2213202 RepID=A0A1Q2KW16_9BACL|nr:hypothetical protein B0X71_03885 [Planococcus lenghuensis]
METGMDSTDKTGWVHDKGRRLHIKIRRVAIGDTKYTLRVSVQFMKKDSKSSADFLNGRPIIYDIYPKSS